MKIGLLAPPWIPLPPPSYGGIETVVTELALGFAARGHEVTVLAAPGSAIPGVTTICALRTLPVIIGEPHAERAHVRAAREALRECDVVIDHSGPLGALACAELAAPSAHVVHGPLTDSVLGTYRGLAHAVPRLNLVSISHAQRRDAPDLPWIGTCHNGLDISDVPFSANPGDYLAFLGRVCPEKGIREALDLAAAAGLPLRIAAKCREPAERAYFEEVVRPRIGDGVHWLGEIELADKYRLLRGALALAFPIQWEEPFGMVMIEAMATGTPVLATPRGSVPEVVDDGVTGAISADVRALAGRVGAMREIDRRACRAHVVSGFSRDSMTRAYERVIQRLFLHERAKDRDARRKRSRPVVTPAPADAA